MVREERLTVSMGNTGIIHIELSVWILLAFLWMIWTYLSNTFVSKIPFRHSPTPIWTWSKCFAVSQCFDRCPRNSFYINDSWWKDVCLGMVGRLPLALSREERVIKWYYRTNIKSVIALPFRDTYQRGGQTHSLFFSWTSKNKWPFV